MKMGLDSGDKRQSLSTPEQFACRQEPSLRWRGPLGGK